MKRLTYSLIALLAMVFYVPVVVQARTDLDERNYPPPQRYDETILRFEGFDAKKPPPRHAVVCVGSSSMGGWHDTIREDLTPLDVIPRGFGGSTMNDVLHYVDRVVLAYEPRAILLYEGDNDVAFGVEPEVILETFHALVRRVHTKIPACRIYVLSIKPSIARWRLWPTMQKTNQMLADACARKARLFFIDVASPLLGTDDRPRRELFKEDDLHMTRAGYLLWRDAVRPVLVSMEQHLEALYHDAHAQPTRLRSERHPSGGR